MLAQVRAGLAARYGVTLGAAACNYYRDGRDSVAPHGDRELRDTDDTLVCLLTLGATRPFRLRPHGRTGGPTHDIAPGSGDVLVMGGACQRDWEHACPEGAQRRSRGCRSPGGGSAVPATDRLTFRSPAAARGSSWWSWSVAAAAGWCGTVGGSVGGGSVGGGGGSKTGGSVAGRFRWRAPSAGASRPRGSSAVGLVVDVADVDVDVDDVVVDELDVVGRKRGARHLGALHLDLGGFFGEPPSLRPSAA